ncbi:MAG: hypothetical protein H6550_08430 [Chitinophagales bacterium]|nr:hypothetical protein [Chitinophagales bacterium]
MKNNLLFLFTTLFCLGIFHSTVSGQNLGVYPTTLDFKLSGGQSEAQVISLSNGSANKVQFRVYLNDWVRDSVGGHIYYEPATTERSCAKWLTIDKNFIELQPGESTQLTVQMLVPTDPAASSQMKWAMLFIETVEENVSKDDKTAQASVKNLIRVGVHIYQTPPGLSEKSIKVIDLVPNKEIPNTYDLVCKNTGDVMIECKAYLQLAAANGEETKLDFIEFPMFPGQKRYVTFELPKNLPDGKYNALGVLDAGEDIPLEAVESSVEVKTVTDSSN